MPHSTVRFYHDIPCLLNCTLSCLFIVFVFTFVQCYNVKFCLVLYVSAFILYFDTMVDLEPNIAIAPL